MILKSSAAILMISLFASAALGQNQLILDKLKQLDAAHPTLEMSAAKAAIFDTAKRFADEKGECLPTDVQLEQPVAITGDPAILPALLSGQIKNAWKVYAQYQGCGNRAVDRFSVIDFADGKRIALLVNSGATNSSMKLMRDTSMLAAMQAYQAAKSKAPSCDGKDLEMIGAQIVSEADDLGPELYGVRYVGGWTENWRFSTCGLIFDVPVQFTADGDGGAYTNIKAENVQQIESAP
tara:strand:- start:2488 stop:3198 length:711 start_codon:yes stop_codon:yes gene_type:complete